MELNPLFAADFYKTGHIYQYPKGTEYVYSNMTARSTQHANMPKSFDSKVVFVGLQGFIKWWLIGTWNKNFFDKPKQEVVEVYRRRMDNALGRGVVTPEHIAELHDLGYLPVLIKALPEGSRVNIKVPFLTIQSTHPNFFWLTNYLEDVISNGNWKAITVATIAYEFRKILNKYVEMTGSEPSFADWQLHDFSMRGLSNPYDSAIVGASHLMAAGFGSDNIPALDYLEQYYNADSDKEIIGGGVPATEHSVMCMGGQEGELETFRRLIQDVYPSGIVSIVSDSWDFWQVITEYSVALKDVILNRIPDALGMAKVVFRPDSGDPVKIVTGLTFVDITEEGLGYDGHDKLDYEGPDVALYQGKYYNFELDSDYEYGESFNYRVTLGDEVPAHVVKGAVECLWDIFGGDINAKGYKTLNQRVGLIYGDSITLDRAEKILKRLADKGFSAGNIVFGIGSYTYQHITRDTFGMAIKATFGVVNGEDRELFKDPKTGDGMKKSAKGLLRVEKEGDNFVLYDQQTREQEAQGALEPVFHNGHLMRETSLAEIRERLKQ